MSGHTACLINRRLRKLSGLHTQKHRHTEALSLCLCSLGKEITGSSNWQITGNCVCLFRCCGRTVFSCSLSLKQMLTSDIAVSFPSHHQSSQWFDASCWAVAQHWLNKTHAYKHMKVHLCKTAQHILYYVTPTGKHTQPQSAHHYEPAHSQPLPL